MPRRCADAAISFKNQNRTACFHGHRRHSCRPAKMKPRMRIRTCREDEQASMLAIINTAAEAYRGVIPADRWHEPYMSAHELASEIAAGSALLVYLREQTNRQVLVGTWTAATWAIRFYEKHDFWLVTEPVKELLLRTYWTISQRQIATSVVL